MKKWTLLILICLLASCSMRPKIDSDTVVSLQLIDRNGMTETISNQERLKTYQDINFLTPQPYQKVLRVYGRNPIGGVPSKITSYHLNGHVYEYLEVLNGRAHGAYCQWHPNGLQRVEACLMEGTADLSDVAKMSWVFDGTSTVWDAQGHIEAIISYDKGVLDTPSLYFYPSGELKEILPYRKGALDGVRVLFSETGTVIGSIPYVLGQRHGLAFQKEETYSCEEEYSEDLLMFATYRDQNHKPIATVTQGFGKKALFQEGHLERLIEIRYGKEEGLVEIFDPKGRLHISYSTAGGKKNGEEIEYRPTGQPKISLSWHDDILHGQVKTYYLEGALESQREFHNNKKQGYSFAWYQNGDLMCAEEYEADKLIKGTYFKKGEKDPISSIDDGKGTATLYTGEGLFLKKIIYERGMPAR